MAPDLAAASADPAASAARERTAAATRARRHETSERENAPAGGAGAGLAVGPGWCVPASGRIEIVLDYTSEEAPGRDATEFLIEASCRHALEVVLAVFVRAEFCKDVERGPVRTGGTLIRLLLSVSGEEHVAFRGRAPSGWPLREMRASSPGRRDGRAGVEVGPTRAGSGSRRIPYA